MPTININTTAVAVGAFFPGDTVTITLYDLEKPSAPIEVSVDTNACVEIFNDPIPGQPTLSTEVFRWSFANITGGQTLGSFMYQMKNQNGVLQSDIFQIVPDGGISPGPIYSVLIQLFEYDAVTSTPTTLPILNAPTYIYNAAETAIITIKNSDSNGQVLVPLNDGTFVIAPQKAGTSFTKETITILNGVISQSGGGVVTTVNTYGSVYTVPAPANVTNACRVFEHCFDVNSITPLPSVSATAQIQTEFYDTDGKLHSVQTIAGTYNSATGLVFWDIVWGSKVTFSIQETGLQKTILIPSQLVARLMEI